MSNLFEVRITKRTLKSLKKIPAPIVVKLQAWVDAVGHYGLSEARKIPGYHDEPLFGDRIGQRSIRLSRSYRAIYIIDTSEYIKCVEIIEINKHEY